jgi:uroporphyrin-III C-methyltransferase/precorrin-2 dehydrogenase/sirohydrochlorin ferrochelatase
MNPPDSIAEPYPAGLRLAGRRVVVVGGGQVAQRRLPGLLAAHADVVLVAPDVTPAVEAMAARRELRWVRRRYQHDDLDGAWYVLAVTDDPVVNAAVTNEAERRRVFCVRADDASAATAWTPAVGRHAGITVAVLGGSHGLPDPRRAAAVRDGVLEGLREGTIAAARVRHKVPGVALVGGGPGDPDLITVRGRHLLAEADVVVADRLAPRALLDELPAHVEVVDAAKIPYGRAVAQDAINALLVEQALAGKFVVRLKGGDPYVFGRGYEEVLACAQAGVPCTVVPGVTSATAVPAVAGIPVTHRGVAHEFTVVSGHMAPSDPGSLVDWAALARLHGTLVLLMAIERLREIAETLVRNGRAADTPVAVVQDGTTAGQRVVRATLADVADVTAREAVRPPAIVVVGGVVALADDTADPCESRRAPDRGNSSDDGSDHVP